MLTLATLTLAVLTLAACHDGADDDAAQSAPEWVELCRVRTAGQGLYAGQAAPRTVAMTEANRLSLVTVHPEVGEMDGGLCTGTLVADGWVLTAAHCVPDPQAGASVRFGPDMAAPVLSVPAQSALLHPQHDVALLQLSTSRWSQLVGAEPIPLWSEPIPRSWLGQRLELAGRGLTRDGDVGALLFVPEPVTALHADTVEVDGMGDSGACVGDSGGPLLASDDGGTVHVAGTLTMGAASCMGKDLYVRADRIWDWVMDTMADHPVGDDDPCTGW